MAVRPPKDGVVALRSLGRRFRAVFAGLGEDESADALAMRPGADGRSALDHVVAATEAVTAGARDLEPVLGPAHGAAPAGGGTGSPVDEAVDELARVAGALADRAEHVSADDWAKDEAIPALWRAVDAAIEHLRTAERTIAEVRGKP
jgi:hypothetical protein